MPLTLNSREYSVRTRVGSFGAISILCLMHVIGGCAELSFPTDFILPFSIAEKRLSQHMEDIEAATPGLIWSDTANSTAKNRQRRSREVSYLINYNELGVSNAVFYTEELNTIYSINSANTATNRVRSYFHDVIPDEHPGNLLDVGCHGWVFEKVLYNVVSVEAKGKLRIMFSALDFSALPGEPLLDNYLFRNYGCIDLRL